jgi:hypothetical protein
LNLYTSNLHFQFPGVCGERPERPPHLICPCKTFYNIFLKKYTERPINSQNKWENLLNIKEVNWEFVYILSNDCTLDNALKMFQYKLYIPTNTFLYKCRLVETELRAFCEKNSFLHLCLSKDITPEKEGTTFLKLQE